MEKHVLKKYYNRIVREGVIKALMCGLIIGFSLLCIFATVSWFDEGSNLFLWIGLGVFVASTAIATVLFYFFKFRASVKSTAQRLDALGLEERLLTMVELEGDDSFMARKQREDSHKVLETVNTKLLKFAVTASVCVGIGVSCVFGLGMTTVSAFSPVSGQEFFGKVAQEIKPTYYRVDYNYENSLKGKGKVLTEETLKKIEAVLKEPLEEIDVMEILSEILEHSDVSQRLLAGTDAQPVVAVPNTGWRFDSWSDGVKTPYRWDKEVSGNILVYAIFKEAGEDEPDDLLGDAPDDFPRELGEGWGGNSNATNGSNDHSDTDPDFIDEINKIIDGATYYGGEIFDQSYADALERLSQNDSVPEWVKKMIADYYAAIEK